MSDILRVTGAVSGLDTDELVKKLIKAEQTKVDRVKQDKQYAEWKQEIYREVSTMLKGLQDEYFDLLKPASNLLSTSMFNVYQTGITIGGSTSTKVSASATASASTSKKQITEITQLAQKDAWKSTSKVKGDLKGASITEAIGNINTLIGTDNELSFTMDGVTKTIELDGSYGSYDDLATDLQNKINAAFSGTTVNVTKDGADALSFSVAEEGHTFSINSTNSDLVTAIGMTAGDSNRLDTSKTLADAFGVSGNQEFTINGKAFSFAETTTIKDMMAEINADTTAKVTMSYNSLTDAFKIESNIEGAANNISISETTGTLLTSSMKLADDTSKQGLDAKFTIDGVTTSRSSNTFTVDGVKITLNDTLSVADGPIDINITSDATGAVDAIKGFVEKYNETIEFINRLTSQKRNFSFKPLTDDQRQAMNEDDIERWEEQAKSGLLRSDSILQGITSKMRVALYENIDGVNISLKDIGITSSEEHTDNGKLLLDETKLKEALETRSDEVMELFTKESSTKYEDVSNRSTRYTENGLANRINDILNDNVRLRRDEDGNKGFLIEKAGFVGDTTEFDNDIKTSIDGYEDRINDLLDALASQEARYYNMFSKLEVSMSRLNNQSGWLQSQLGS